MSNDYPSWNVGVEFRMPLTNQQAKSAFNAAAQRYSQAVLEGEATELALNNTLDTKIQKARQIRDELGEHRRNVELREVILKTELDRLQAGKGEVHDVLESEERLNEARIAELKSRIEFEKAVAAVELAEGALLDRYGVKLELGDGE